MPRYLNSVWQHFERDTSKSNNIQAICKACKSEIQGIISRLEKNVVQCKKLDKTNSSVSVSAQQKRSLNCSGSDNSEITNPKRQKLLLDNHVVKTSADEKKANLHVLVLKKVGQLTICYRFLNNK